MKMSITVSFSKTETNGHEADLDLPRLPHKINNFDNA